jgi:hypothetical protein
MNDTALTDSKNAEKDLEEAVVQLVNDSRNQTFKGTGILILFLAACGGFLGGIFWAADKVNQVVKTSFGDPENEALPARTSISP